MTVMLFIISAFYMFIYLVAELTAVGGAVSLITGIDPLGPVLGTSLVTLAYSSFGGERAAMPRVSCAQLAAAGSAFLSRALLDLLGRAREARGCCMHRAVRL